MNRTTCRANEINVADGERWISAIGGIALAIVGLSRKSLAGLALALGGAYLLYRGAIGHCYLYQLMGKTGPSANMLPPDTSPPPSIDRGDEVAESSWESFPTSDAPSWTMGREREDTGG